MSFVEILVSLFLFALMLLGFNGMQLVALRESQAALYGVLANEQLKNLGELLACPTKQDGLAVSCKVNHEELISLWQNQIRQELPNLTLTVVTNAPYYQVTIFWGNKKNASICKGVEIEQAGGCIRRQIFIH